MKNNKTNICYEYEKKLSPEKIKKEGIVYTPAEIVSYINSSLLLQWKQENEVPPHMCDFSCGTGVFLVDAVEKISSMWNIPLEEAMVYVHGSDTDSDAVRIAQKLLPGANITTQDGFDASLQKIDIVVGNPPYVRIQNLDTSTREIVKNFEWCEGDFDIYVSFIEKAFKNVSYLGFICPSGWLKNKSNKNMRKDILSSQRLYELVDFQDIKVFPEFGTYTSILMMNNKQNQQLTIKHRNINNLEIVKNYTDITEQNFYSDESEDLFIKSIQEYETPLFDICDIKVGLATLYDKAYYLEDCIVQGSYVILKDGSQIEKDITRPCKKAGSIRKLKENKHHRIIFPYDNKEKLIPLKVFEKEYPLAMNHLAKFKTKLIKRDSGKIDQIEWHQYGRTQGLKGGTKKLLLPPLLKDPCVFEDKDSLFISGYAVYMKAGKEHLVDKVRKEFSSKRMAKWISIKGRPMANGWRGVNKQTFKEYKINFNDNGE